jgi:hypothetical protein
MTNDRNLDAPKPTTALTIADVDAAVELSVQVNPQDVFYTDFRNVRGVFEERELFASFKLNENKEFDYQRNQFSKFRVFLGGMRGSGKTTELLKIAKDIDNSKAFFVVYFSIDDALNMGTTEYIDILIYQIEQLLLKASDENIELSDRILKDIYTWMADRVEEIKDESKGSIAIETGVEVNTGMLFSILKFFGSFKAQLSAGTTETITTRNFFKNRFSELSEKVNIFFAEVANELRNQERAQDLLFLIDGFEKTFTADKRKELLIDNSIYYEKIKANTLFTLPIELTKEELFFKNKGTVLHFPFVKLQERNGTKVEKAYQQFREFVYKRISPVLFDSEDTVNYAINYGGGSPRELLRILQYAAYYHNPQTQRIERESVDRAIKRLASEYTRHINEESIKKLIEVQYKSEKGIPVTNEDIIYDLLEDVLLMEYNDGHYKRVNPIVMASEMYQYYDKQQ